MQRPYGLVHDLGRLVPCKCEQGEEGVRVGQIGEEGGFVYGYLSDEDRFRRLARSVGHFWRSLVGIRARR